MSRPIDADALMRAMYERAFETDGDTMWQSGCWVRYRAIEEVVKEQPTIEPQPIIHCKDCIHIRHWNRQECSINDRVVEDTDFCSWAERRQDG